MIVHRQISHRTTAAPPAGVVRAPPVLNASDNTIDFTCGTCGTVLLYAEEDQIHNVTILCTACGSFNSTNA